MVNTPIKSIINNVVQKSFNLLDTVFETGTPENELKKAEENFEKAKIRLKKAQEKVQQKMNGGGTIRRNVTRKNQKSFRKKKHNN